MQILKVTDRDRITSFHMLTLITLDPSTFLNRSRCDFHPARFIKVNWLQLTPAPGYFVDGYDEVTRTVYEFHGCWFHECKRRFKDKRYVTRNSHLDRTVEQVYEATVRKTQMLRQAGYTVIEKWECEYQKGKKTNVEFQEFLKTYEVVPLLNPRDAFFGGRTWATTLYAQADPEEEIKSQDYTSLSPWVNKYWEYPERFPEVHLNQTDQDIKHFFGVAVVDVWPPERLFHPVRRRKTDVPVVQPVRERWAEKTLVSSE